MNITINIHECDRHRSRKRPVSGHILFAPIGETMAKATLSADDNGVSAALVFRDKKGNVAPVYGKPEWSLTNDTTVDMTVSDDGMSAQFAPKGAAGEVTVNVLAQGEEDGSQPIPLTGDIEVIPADAEVGELSFGPVT